MGNYSLKCTFWASETILKISWEYNANVKQPKCQLQLPMKKVSEYNTTIIILTLLKKNRQKFTYEINSVIWRWTLNFDRPGGGENFKAETSVNLYQRSDGAQAKVFLHHSEAVFSSLPIHQLVVLYCEPASVNRKLYVESSLQLSHNCNITHV